MRFVILTFDATLLAGWMAASLHATVAPAEDVIKAQEGEIEMLKDWLEKNAN